MKATPPKTPPFDSGNVLSLVLGGGRGTRLFPLTKMRAKPAVPLGGKYRLVDIPISNCINSGLRQVYVLTQFNSASLHRHISQSYKFDHLSRGFVEILAAEQTLTDASWYQGTADAVRKNLAHILNHPFEYLLILSGDQLYRMDFRQILTQHVETGADVTVATIPVARRDVPGFGIMQMNADWRIVRFVEKPKDSAVQDAFRLEREWYARLHIESDAELFLASMGIYVFKRQALLELLDNELDDFGKHIIPAAIQSHRIYAHVFQGYWEDIGTIRSFFEANLDLASAQPQFDFFDVAAPIFTHPRFLPPSKIGNGRIQNSLISDGCIFKDASIEDSLIGVRSIVGTGSELRRVVMMGADYYDTARSRQDCQRSGRPCIGIGANTHIENAIIDKNACIGDNCHLSPANKPANVDEALYYIRDGIVIIPKNAVVPHGTVF